MRVDAASAATNRGEDSERRPLGCVREENPARITGAGPATTRREGGRRAAFFRLENGVTVRAIVLMTAINLIGFA